MGREHRGESNGGGRSGKHPCAFRQAQEHNISLFHLQIFPFLALHLVHTPPTQDFPFIEGQPNINAQGSHRH
jgi:hypothetical protein